MTEMISLIIPAYNERENLQELYESLKKALDATRENYEIIFIDDGSVDGSGLVLEKLAASDTRVRLIQFGRNFGQTAALSAGFNHARGDILVTSDADLQNDPADIPLLLAKLREGYDVISCRRMNRKDPFLTRRLPSMIANHLISRITGLELRDYGCTLKAYRRSAIEHIRLYGEMHRFIPVYAFWAGARVAEIPIRHRPRRSGESKYGLGRIHRVFLDLITVIMLGNYSTKPMYFFGGTGLVACAGGLFCACWTLADKFANDIKAHRNPLLLLAVFLFLLGIQFIFMGLVAELLIRTYFESQNKTTYVIRRMINLEPEHNPPSSGGSVSPTGVHRPPE